MTLRLGGTDIKWVFIIICSILGASVAPTTVVPSSSELFVSPTSEIKGIVYCGVYRIM